MIKRTSQEKTEGSKDVMYQGAKRGTDSRFLIGNSGSGKTVGHHVHRKKEKPGILYAVKIYFKNKDEIKDFFRYIKAERAHHQQTHPLINVTGTSSARNKVILGRNQNLDKGTISMGSAKCVRKCMTCILPFKHI